MPLPSLPPIAERPDLAVEKKSKTAGRGLFAKENINAGDVILIEERPVVSVVVKGLRYDVCSWCFMTAGTPQVQTGQEDNNLRVNKCGGCHVLAYCSKECQTSAWKHVHKYECKALASATEQGKHQMPNIPYMIMQMLLLYKNESLGKLDADGKQRLNIIRSLHEDLNGVEKEAQRKGQGDMMFGIAYGAHHYAGGAATRQTPEKALELMAKISTNSLTLVNPSFDTLGAAIYDRTSCLNHSCDPNVIVTFDGPVLRLSALKPIKKNEELFWSYISSDMPYHRRQTDLQRVYCFACRCGLCKKGEQPPHDEWRPGRPPTVMMNLRGVDQSMVGKQTQPDPKPYLPKGADPDRLDGTTRFRADICSMLEWYRGIAGRAPRAQPDDVGDPFDDGFSATDMSVTICGLDFAARCQLMPPTMFPYCSLRSDFIVMCLGLPYFATAFRYSLAQYFLIDPVLLQPNWHPLRVITKWMLANLALNMAALDIQSRIADLTRTRSIRDKIEINSLRIIESAQLNWGVVAYGFLIEARDNVQISHGSGSRFAGVVRSKLEEMEVDMTRADPDACRSARPMITDQWEVLRRIAEGVDDAELREAAGPTAPPPGVAVPEGFPDGHSAESAMVID